MAREPLHLKTAITVLREHGEMRAKALAQAVGVSDATLLSGIKTAVLHDEILRRQDGREVYYRLPDQQAGEPTLEVPASAPKFNASLWADGELILWNVDLNEDGRSLTLNADETRTLRRLLVGA